MSENLLEHITNYSDFLPNEEAWGVYVDRFFKSLPISRQAQLQQFDKFVDDNDKLSRPSREAADLIARRRELTDLHALLRKAGQ